MAQDATKASTQAHLDIDDITQDLVLLKNGSCAVIMSTTAVNFDILSEAEQDATIYAYGALLNSLSFPVQILIRSKKADISSYFAHLTQALESQQNPDLKAQIQKYMEFIQATVQQKTVLDKKFYLIISFSTLELGFKGLKKSKSKAKSKAQLISDAIVSLRPKMDHLIKQTARLGLVTKQMATKELIELFYDIYNPEPTGTQKTVIDSGAYRAVIVQPALEVPTPPPGGQVKAEPQKIVYQPTPTTPLAQTQLLEGLQQATNQARQFVQNPQVGQTQNGQVITNDK